MENANDEQSVTSRSSKRRQHVYDRRGNQVHVLPRISGSRKRKRQNILSTPKTSRKRLNKTPSTASTSSQGGSVTGSNQAPNDLITSLEKQLAAARAQLSLGDNISTNQMPNGNSARDSQEFSQESDDDYNGNNQEIPVPVEEVPQVLAQNQRELASIWEYISRLDTSASSSNSQQSSAKEARDQLLLRKELDLYDGTTPFRQWWWRVLHLQNSNRWSNETTLATAIARLNGNAIAVYQAHGLNDPSTTLDKFKEVMQSVCKHGALDQTINSKIRHAQIEENQTVQEFSAYLTSLFNMLDSRPSQEFMISALLDGVASKMDPIALQLARAKGDFARATRLLIEIEAHQSYRDSIIAKLPVTSSHQAHNQSQRRQYQNHYQPRAQKLPRNMEDFNSKETSFYCAKHGRNANHSSETCNLEFCDQHGWCSHSTNNCRALQRRNAPREPQVHGKNLQAQGRPEQQKTKSPYWAIKQLQTVDQAQKPPSPSSQQQAQDLQLSENFPPTPN